jgi:hypothetical protein
MAEKTVARRLFAKLPLGDRERARRVLEASALDPAESTALLYGPVAGELTSVPPTDATPGEERAEDGGQQTEEAETGTASALPSAASSVPDSEEPDLDDGFKVPDEVAQLQAAAEEASFLVVDAPEFPKANGKTLAQIAATKASEQWYAKALRIATPGPLREAIIAFARVNLPEVYGAYLEEQEGQEQLA